MAENNVTPLPAASGPDPGQTLKILAIELDDVRRRTAVALRDGTPSRRTDAYRVLGAALVRLDATKALVEDLHELAEFAGGKETSK